MKKLVGMMMLVAFAVASAPLAAAECVEGAGSAACVNDYSNDDATMYFVEAYAVDGTYAYVWLLEGPAFVGGKVLTGDAWVDSPTLGAGVYGFAFAQDGIPSDGSYERVEAYGEVYTYDGDYEYVWLGLNDNDGDGVHEDHAYATSASAILP